MKFAGIRLTFVPPSIPSGSVHPDPVVRTPPITEARSGSAQEALGTAPTSHLPLIYPLLAYALRHFFSHVTYFHSPSKVGKYFVFTFLRIILHVSYFEDVLFCGSEGNMLQIFKNSLGPGGPQSPQSCRDIMPSLTANG